jgi:hypothetical protein
MPAGNGSPAAILAGLALARALEAERPKKMISKTQQQHRELFDTMIRLANDPSSELYQRDGNRRTGATHRNAFWAGADGLSPRWCQNPTSMSRTCWKAGKEFARRSKADKIQGALGG